jgi:hypothetical protein
MFRWDFNSASDALLGRPTGKNDSSEEAEHLLGSTRRALTIREEPRWVPGSLKRWKVLLSYYRPWP